MQKLLILSVIFFLQSGFMMTNSLSNQIAAMEKAVQQGALQGIDKDTKFSKSFPPVHDGPFSSIEQLDFVIRTGTYKDKNASAILVKYHNSSTWHVLDVYIQEDSNWTKISKSKKGNQ
ncbi:MAG TPA: hypothetical protein EYP39_02845 [Ghiorsea sp.]|nr:hypothetical protein [Ghiorsea sp.]